MFVYRGRLWGANLGAFYPILDEATSQIDMQSEQLILESPAEHRRERTRIIITQREKLLELADRVFEVVEGQFIERPHLARDAA